MPLESRKSALSCDLSTLTATGDAEIYVYFEKNVAHPEWLSRIPDPNWSILDPGSKRERIPDLDPQKGI
jgi:hypothetical protein